MVYLVVVGGMFGLLFGETAGTVAPEKQVPAGLVAFAGLVLSLAIPPRLFRYTTESGAAVVLTQLMKRAAFGSGIILTTTLATWLLIGRLDNPRVLGELYVFTAIGIFILQGFGETIARHTMYLQQTHQYNSNQLVAVLLTVTLLLFTLALYFLAFDLARPPEFHAYLRDLTAITLLLIGYGRAVYLIAHH